MRTSTVRYVLISALVAFGLLVSSAAAGSAAVTARSAAVVFGLGSAPATGPSVTSPVTSPVTASSPGSAPTCPAGSLTCASTDRDVSLAWSSAVSTAGCRFRLVLDWGDGAATQTVDLAGSSSRKVWTVAHTYSSRLSARHPYPISATGTVLGDPQARGCSVESAAVTFTLLCTDKQLSGPAFSTRWPGGDRNVTDLNAEFRPEVESFIAAMTRAGITVQPQSTLRSPQRAYLMHYSYLIAKGLLAPQNVPSYLPLAGEKGPGVCWLHRTAAGTADPKASATAARALLSALGVDASLRTPPALRSRHITGDAIDMQLQWPAASITIDDATGRPVTITSDPHDGTNPDLIAVGATYGVHHFSPIATDRNHWSSDGH